MAERDWFKVLGGGLAIGFIAFIWATAFGHESCIYPAIGCGYGMAAWAHIQDRRNKQVIRERKRARLIDRQEWKPPYAGDKL
jgi:hypothetical protein